MASSFNWKNYPVLKWEPTSNQVEAVGILGHRQRFLLADATGLGKTYSALASYAYVRERYEKTHLLVLCTKSASVSWRKDIKKGTEFTFEELGSDCKHKDSTVPSKDITILTYTALKKFPNYMVSVMNSFNVVLVMDEAHRLKNPKALAPPIVARLLPHVLCAWMLTATPVTNHPEDLYRLVSLLLPGYLGDEWHFLQQYTVGQDKLVPVREKPGSSSRGNFKFINGRKFRVVREIVGHRNLGKLREKLKPILLRRDLDMDVEFIFKPVEMTPEEDAKYLIAAAGFLGGGFKAFSQRLPDLQLAANNAVDLDKKPNKAAQLASKEVKLLDCVKEELDKAHPVLIFTGSLVTKERLKRLMKRHLIFNYRTLYEIDGSTSKKNRDLVARKFGPKDVLIISRAGGESLNLQAAGRIIFFDLPFDMKAFAQAVGRVARMDTTHAKVEVVVLEAQNTIDTYKAAMLLTNVEVFRKVLTGAVTLPDACRAISKSELAKLRKDLLWRTKDLR